jgi:glycosyltransferase involved in cell wall biosynthesis
MTAPSPLVSVGMPVYNAARFLERAVHSLLDQDYPDLEIIISDNCSNDETPAICQRLVQHDPRISYHRNTTNIGAVANFARLPSLARGAYFMWAAYDDLWHPQCVSLLVRELTAHPEAGLAHSAVVLVDDTGARMAEDHFPPTDNPNHWSCTETATRCVSSTRPKLNYAMYGLFRTDVVRKAVPYARDVPVWDRLFVVLLAMMTPFRYCDAPLYLRTLQDTRANERYPEDGYAKQTRSNQWWRAQAVVNLGRLLIVCPHIPTSRKLAIPRLLYIFGRNQWQKRKAPSQKRRRVLEFKRSGVFRKAPRPRPRKPGNGGT